MWLGGQGRVGTADAWPPTATWLLLGVCLEKVGRGGCFRVVEWTPGPVPAWPSALGAGPQLPSPLLLFHQLPWSPPSTFPTGPSPQPVGVGSATSPPLSSLHSEVSSGQGTGREAGAALAAAPGGQGQMVWVQGGSGFGSGCHGPGSTARPHLAGHPLGAGALPPHGWEGAACDRSTRTGGAPGGL